MAKTLILVRHAHRDNSRRERDNGLTAKGHAQARNLRKFFAARFGVKGPKGSLWLVSSPKVRCLQTLEPLAKITGRPVDVHPWLDEQGPRETHECMVERVHAFLDEWTHSRVSTTVLCSHGDWLPMAAFHLLGIPLEQKKGGWLELEWNRNRGVMRWLVPSFKTFYR